MSVGAPAHAKPVPRSYLGLSTEYLPIYERRLSLFERVLALLHVSGGPLVLRIGGDSADHAFWDPSSQVLPAWAFELTPAWLSRTTIRGASAELVTFNYRAPAV